MCALHSGADRLAKHVTVSHCMLSSGTRFRGAALKDKKNRRLEDTMNQSIGFEKSFYFPGFQTTANPNQGGSSWKLPAFLIPASGNEAISICRTELGTSSAN